MNKNYLLEKPLLSATLGDLKALLQDTSNEAVLDCTPSISPIGRKVYGLKGIANELKISESTVQRFISKGKLDGALSRVGKTIVADVDKLWAIFKCNQKLKYAHQYDK